MGNVAKGVVNLDDTVISCDISDISKFKIRSFVILPNQVFFLK